jgi:hypothetical protein
MTSLTSTDAVILGPMDKERPLLVDKNGAPLNKQVPRLQQQYNGAGGETILFDGSNSLFVNGVNGALAGVLTINATSVANLRGRNIAIHVRGGVGQNVVVNFPVAGYPIYVTGAAGAGATTQTITANANNQVLRIEFGTNAAFIN